MLHNLIGTLCVCAVYVCVSVDVDFLGTNCNKKLCLILHPNAEEKRVLFSQETVQKLQKKTKPKKTKPKDSQVIVIACLQHTEQFAPSSLYEAFFHSREHRKHTFFFFFFLVYGCVELIFFLLLFIFVVFYAKGREASDNLYTVYTAHPFTTLPTSRPHPCLHCTRTLRR